MLTQMQLGNYNARVIVTGLERRLTLGQLIFLRLIVPIVIYFVSHFFPIRCHPSNSISFCANSGYHVCPLVYILRITG